MKRDSHNLISESEKISRRLFSWVKVFRIIPEFGILRLTFYGLKILNKESQPQNPELGTP